MRYKLHEWQHLGLKAYFGMMTNAITWQAQMMSAMKYPLQWKTPPASFFNNVANENNRSFNLVSTEISGKDVRVTEEIIDDRDFASLIHFRRDIKRNDPKVLIVVPTSGHYPTLLRDFVSTLLPDHDIYLTNWKNARDIPVAAGEFGLEDYLDYTQDFIRQAGPDVHVIGYSQSTIPVLAATALMAARKGDVKPLSMTLMAGPIDTRAAHSALSEFALTKDPAWFSSNAVVTVPPPFKGAGRAVYPGVFSVNPVHKIHAHLKLFNALARNDQAEANRIQRFENEYDRVSDVHGKLYMDFIHHYFQQHTLPQGRMTWRNEKVEPARITRTALLTIEAGNDEITAPGQTLPAHGLCSALKKSQHFHYTQPGIDHYGIISGRESQTGIIPRIAAFLRDAAARNGIAYDKAEGVTITPGAIDPAPQRRYLIAVNSSNGNHRNGSGPRSP